MSHSLLLPCDGVRRQGNQHKVYFPLWALASHRTLFKWRETGQMVEFCDGGREGNNGQPLPSPSWVEPTAPPGERRGRRAASNQGSESPLARALRA